MTCATTSLACPRLRRPATRAPHLCRGRGGRGCRCHVAARPHLALPDMGRTPLWRDAPDGSQPSHQRPRRQPQRPQGPPLPV